jgi:hypothetical protein
MHKRFGFETNWKAVASILTILTRFTWIEKIYYGIGYLAMFIIITIWLPCLLAAAAAAAADS